VTDRLGLDVHVRTRSWTIHKILRFLVNERNCTLLRVTWRVGKTSQVRTSSELESLKGRE